MPPSRATTWPEEEEESGGGGMGTYGPSSGETRTSAWFLGVREGEGWGRV